MTAWQCSLFMLLLTFNRIKALVNCNKAKLSPKSSFKSNLFSTRTQYTIDDTTCPPTDADTLRRIIVKHVQNLDLFLEKKSIAAHTSRAFDFAQNFVDEFYSSNQGKASNDDYDDDLKKRKRAVILDSGCGTGRSTLLLSQQYPEYPVIGIDRSFVRLKKSQISYAASESSSSSSSTSTAENQESDDDEGSILAQTLPSEYPNMLLLRAELSDFYRCALDNQWDVYKHYMLYPNPYPKKSRLKSRWYGHPAFPLLLKLGGNLTIRSNWEGFLKEFAQSIEYVYDELSERQGEEGRSNYAEQYLKGAKSGPKRLIPDEKFVPMTNFEKKFVDCGEPCYELTI